MNVYFIPQTILTAAFLRAVLLGMVLGVVYDLTRSPRRAFRLHAVVSALLDGTFVFMLLLLCFHFFVVWAYGLPRGWFAGGIALGGLLYFYTLSPLVLLVLVTIWTILRKGLILLCRLYRKLFWRMQRLTVCEKIQKKSKYLFHFPTK